MGKQSGRPGRRDRSKRAKFTSTAELLRMVVATAPFTDADGDVSLRRDIDLVRAGLLYADRIELLSPAAVMLNKVVAAQQHGPVALAEMMLACTDDQLRAFGYTGDVAELRRSFDPLLAWNTLSRAEQRRRFGAKEASALRDLVSDALASADQGPQGFTATVDRLIDGSGGWELLEAIDAGIVTILDSPFELGGNTDDQVQAFTEKLVRQIEEPGSYLLFDESVSSFTRAMVEEGLAVPHVLTVARARRAITGSGLVARLPAFQGAAMSDILEVRSDLQQQLTSFRRAVNRYARDLESDPFEPAIVNEVNDLWAVEVAPRLDELREALTGTALVKSAVKKLAVQPMAYVVGGAGAALVMGLDIPMEALTPPGVAAAGVAAAAGALSARTQVRRADLYYLLEANDRLS